MERYRYFPGTKPLILSIPHCGTHIPEGLFERLSASARALPDTDWHVDRLYDFAQEMGVHVVSATVSRYVVDLNRGPDEKPLYPGQFNTSLCPTVLFDGSPLYRPGMLPTPAEVQERIAEYWHPYHDQLASLIRQLNNEYGSVTLYDAHSICSQVPNLFDGKLPDINIGTASGASCSPVLEKAMFDCAKASGYSAVLNERFKGGYITRHYGKPQENIHAVQVELAQLNYMREMQPYSYDEKKAEKLRATLRQLVQAALEFAS